MTLRSASVIGAIVAVGILGGAIGRRTAPAPVVQVQERVEYRDRVRVVTVREAAEVQTRVVYRERVATPDGTVREREVERAESARVEQSSTAEARVAETAVDVQRAETPAPAPAWRASLLVGTPVRLTPGPVLVGGHIQRRLWGPVAAGAWTLIPTGPGAPVTAGVLVSLEW